MKGNAKGSILVYFAAILVLVGLVAGTMAYVKWAKAKREKTQQAAVEQTQAEAETRLAKVKIVEIIPVPFTDVLVLPGTTMAYEDIDLASKLSGVIEWIGPKEGGRVKKGEKLLQVEVKSVETRVSETRARYEQALKDYERAKKLHEENIISKNQLDDAQTTLETSKASLDSASVTLGDGTLYSPIGGVLDRLDVDRGEYISPGQTVMKIVDIDKVYIELPVPEKDILYFEKGQKVDLEFSMPRQSSSCKNPKEVEGEKQCWFSGKIDFISMTADSSTRTYTVKVLVDNATGILRPGMIVRAHLIRRELEDAIAVPFFTIIEREDGKAVFVIEDGVARARSIKYGTFDKGLVEVRKGLQPGERLVLVGQRTLVDGQKVEITQDVTPLAKQWIAQGKDLSELSIDILK
jgi:membrane fusion protein (multidrug efflux system)